MISLNILVNVIVLESWGIGQYGLSIRNTEDAKTISKRGNIYPVEVIEPSISCCFYYFYIFFFSFDHGTLLVSSQNARVKFIVALIK